MAVTQEAVTRKGVVYSLEGSLLEACSCGILCPCWVGEDPDGGECFAFNAYHFDRGEIGGIDVSGLNFVRIVHLPGNVLTPGSWRQVIFVDSTASEKQRQALIDVFAGKYGGPLADLAALVGETLGIETMTIRHKVVAGKGRIVIDGVLDSEMEPYRGGDGTITTLRDSVFSTVPGSPAWVGRASTHKVSLSQYGMNWEYEGRNAIQSEYKIEFSR